MKSDPAIPVSGRSHRTGQPALTSRSYRGRLWLLLILPEFYACQPTSQQDKIKAGFDSVDQSLSASVAPLSREERYVAASRRYPGMGWGELQSAVFDARGFLHYLRKDFTGFCGHPEGDRLPPGSENNVRLTHAFFEDTLNRSKYLVPVLKRVQAALLQRSRQQALTQKIQLFTSLTDPPSDGPNKAPWYRNLPPVAVMTIIAKFDHDLEAFEKALLDDYLQP